MQEINREILIAKAVELLQNGTVDRVLGWQAGEFDYDITPAVFETPEQLKQSFVWGDFCGANFSKYLIQQAQNTASKVLAFLKPCDTYSFNQLLTEHRFDREKVYAVGVSCNGMLDINKIKQRAEGVLSVLSKGDTVTVKTLYDGELELPFTDLLAERCQSCKSKKHVAYDELLGTDGEVLDSTRFDEVARLEKMTPDERYAFWQGELSRCIRCNACRDVCPACTCEKCVFDNPNSGVENKSPANSF